MSARVVLVTGGAAGIGWAAAQRFAAAGERVVIADIDGAAAEARAASLGAGAGAITVDMGAFGDPEQMIRDCVARFGRLDVLVNNAGVIDSGGTPVIDQPPEAFRRLLAINLLGMERASVAAAAVMRDQPAAACGNRGIIVNLASGAALRAIPLRNGYSASKAGVVAVTRGHACAWARHGIRVNAVAPGYTRTDLVDELIRRGRVDPALVARRIPMGRMGTPDEIAAAIMYLAGPAARGSAGTLLIVDGASTAYGGSDDAPVERGAAPSAPPAGRPAYVIAGAGSKLGQACARFLVETGAALLLLDTIVEAGDGPMGSIQIAADGPVMLAAMEGFAAVHGRIDGLVNAAGTDTLSDSTIGLRHQLDRHIEGQFLAAQAAGRLMLRQGYGAVVNLTSVSGQIGGAGPIGGSAAAAAIGMLTRTMACEWGGSGLRANTIAAGPMVGDDPAWVARMPQGRMIDPAEVAATAAFLLSRDAGYISGSTVIVDGGLSIYAGLDLEPSA
jgi:NAD(P)-dependent dehydrogenase (short-subunit alcohol dehydrogenase family)